VLGQLTTGLFASLIMANYALATPTSQSMAEAWQEAISYIDDSSTHLNIVDGDWQDVSAGEIVSRRVGWSHGPDSVQALYFVEQPLAAVWIAIIDDPHLHLSAELVEYTLAGSSPERKLLYQLLDLPFPISNRCWVLEISNNSLVYERSGGRVWRREWRALDNGPSLLRGLPVELRGDALSAIYTPVNEGSWTLMTVGNGTLVVYEGRADTAGNLPSAIVDRFAQDSVEESLSRLSDIAATSVSHYVEEGHYIILAPNNEPLEQQ